MSLCWENLLTSHVSLFNADTAARASFSRAAPASTGESSEMSGRGRARAAQSTDARRAKSPACPAATRAKDREDPSPRTAHKGKGSASEPERGPRRKREEVDGGGGGASARAGPRPKPEPNRASPGGKPAREETDPSRILLETLEKLKIKKQHRAEAAATINEVVDMIEKFMEEETECFRQMVTLRTGSAYENVKINEPDEFDVMFAVPVYRTRVQQFGDGSAFCSAHVDRERRTRPYSQFVQEDGTISACDMLNHFRELVKVAVKDLDSLEVKKGCPAVTLQIMKSDMEFPISLDIVLGLEVHSSSWPSFTKDGCKIEKWLGSKVKRDFKFKPFYLVPKYEVCCFSTDAWRISFSHVEKDILKNHGKVKTCCEKQGVQCCRKACLKLLKHLLHTLKERHQKELSEFSSYLAKTVLLHACSSRVDDNYWATANLSHCFQMLLEDFEKYLKSGSLPNFFIPSHNLLASGYSRRSCEHLADFIAEQRNNGFPIFSGSSQ
uniref:Cyclic GMP-AMP synthase n=1 Tax=Scleropages formosus TaxID=113540 RepID=A0A8C9RUU0_SCLFO